MNKSSKYHGVFRNKGGSGPKSRIKFIDNKPWTARLTQNGVRRTSVYYATEREAAIQYDKWVLEYGLDRPLNILKRKAA